jgi:hypothetical protein
MGSTPKPPDPYATAQAQANANFIGAQQNAIMGNVNEYSPQGNKTYQQIGWDPVYDSNGKLTYAPRYQSTVQYSPDQERLYGQQLGLQYNLGNLGLGQSARMQDVYGKEMDWSGMQPWTAAKAPGAVSKDFRQDQTATDRPSIERAMMESYSRSADPRNQQQMTQLAMRGLNPGAQGYGDVARQQGDEFGEATRQAYLGSGQESRAAQEAYNQVPQLRNAATLQDYQMGSDYATQLNNLRQAQATEAFARRNQPLNEIMAMMGASGPTTPTFQPFASPSISPVNISQMVYDNYNAQAQNAAAKNQGLFGLAGAGLSAALAPATGGASLLGGTMLGKAFGR